MQLCAFVTKKPRRSLSTKQMLWVEKKTIGPSLPYTGLTWVLPRGSCFYKRVWILNELPPYNCSPCTVRQDSNLRELYYRTWRLPLQSICNKRQWTVWSGTCTTCTAWPLWSERSWRSPRVTSSRQFDKNTEICILCKASKRNWQAACEIQMTTLRTH